MCLFQLLWLLSTVLFVCYLCCLFVYLSSVSRRQFRVTAPRRPPIEPPPYREKDVYLPFIQRLFTVWKPPGQHRAAFLLAILQESVCNSDASSPAARRRCFRMILRLSLHLVSVLCLKTTWRNSEKLEEDRDLLSGRTDVNRKWKHSTQREEPEANNHFNNSLQLLIYYYFIINVFRFPLEDFISFVKTSYK